MSELRALRKRGNIKGQAIFYGRSEVAIAGASAVTGVTSVTYDPTYDTEPKLIVGLPEMTQTSGGATNYPNSVYLSSKTALVFAIHVWVDTAPGAYKTVTFQFDYIVVGEPND